MVNAALTIILVGFIMFVIAYLVITRMGRVTDAPEDLNDVEVNNWYDYSEKPYNNYKDKK